MRSENFNESQLPQRAQKGEVSVTMAWLRDYLSIVECSQGHLELQFWQIADLITREHKIGFTLTVVQFVLGMTKLFSFVHGQRKCLNGRVPSAYFES